MIPFDPAREGFLQEQLAWAQQSDPLQVRLLYGQGGCGKTRLALECCKRMRALGWQAGFVGGDLSPGQAKNLAIKLQASGQACFAVIDYAETRQDVVLAFVAAWRLHAGAVPLRLLLLARQGGDWWRQLPYKNADCAAILDGGATTGPYEVAQLYQSQSEREQAWYCAHKAFAIKLGLAPTMQAPDISAAFYEHALYLQMSALLCLRGERADTPGSLLRSLLAHEQRYWRNAIEPGWREVDWQRQSDTLMCLNTLCGGLRTAKEAEVIWASLGEEKKDLKSLFERLRQLYPTSKGLPALAPDLLAETLLATYLEQDGGIDLLLELMRQNNSAWQYSALTVCARMLKHRPDLRECLHDVMLQGLQKSLQTVLDVCRDVDSPFSQVFVQVFQILAQDDSGNSYKLALEIAKKVNVNIERRIDAIYDIFMFALELLAKQFEVKCKKKENRESLMEWASSLIMLGVTCVFNGQIDLALQKSMQVRQIWKNLGVARNEDERNHYAAVLVSQGLIMYQLGRLDDAIMFSEEGLEIIGKNFHSNSEEIFSFYGGALNIHGFYLAAVGDYAKSISYCEYGLEECVRHSRKKPRLMFWMHQQIRLNLVFWHWCANGADMKEALFADVQVESGEQGKLYDKRGFDFWRACLQALAMPQTPTLDTALCAAKTLSLSERDHWQMPRLLLFCLADSQAHPQTPPGWREEYARVMRRQKVLPRWMQDAAARLGICFPPAPVALASAV
ncbi:hypothetical protein V8J88_13310 [Massilia sp. W12]|uniref:hypothetical protein n=1 Tax=Massilia sp. W12 TaxID=3126507 RepID=UPI0030CCDDA4